VRVVRARITVKLLGQAKVNHILDVRHCDGALGDARRNDDLAPRGIRSVEDAHLLLEDNVRVQREDGKFAVGQLPLDQIGQQMDVLHARHKHKHGLSLLREAVDEQVCGFRFAGDGL